MKNKAIVFSDVDGTLYGSDFVVKSETVKHIHQAIDNHDLEFVIATGNPPFTKHQNLAQLLKARYIITSNGATIFDNQTKKYLYKKEINQTDQIAIIQAAQNFDLHLNFWNEQNYFVLNHKEPYLITWNYCLIDPNEVVKNTFTPQNGIVKMEFFGKPENIAKAQKVLNKLAVQAILMRPEHIEITAQNTSKGIAIQWFLENVIQQEQSNVMVIGDSPNDWSMFALGGYSYAMANARGDTKQRAKYHTAAHDQNGVGLAINDYLYRYKNIKPQK